MTKLEFDAASAVFNGAIEERATKTQRSLLNAARFDTPPGRSTWVELRHAHTLTSHSEIVEAIIAMLLDRHGQRLPRDGCGNVVVPSTNASDLLPLLRQQMIEYLAGGTWRARGSLPDDAFEHRQRKIPPPVWRNAHIDWERGQIVSPNGKVLAVSIEVSIPDDQRLRPTIRGEGLCQSELEAMMREDASQRRPKGTIRNEMCRKHSISARGFDRAWLSAIRATGMEQWLSGGRPRIIARKP